MEAPKKKKDANLIQFSKGEHNATQFRKRNQDMDGELTRYGKIERRRRNGRREEVRNRVIWLR